MVREVLWVYEVIGLLVCGFMGLFLESLFKVSRCKVITKILIEQVFLRKMTKKVVKKSTLCNFCTAEGAFEGKFEGELEGILEDDLENCRHAERYFVLAGAGVVVELVVVEAETVVEAHLQVIVAGLYTELPHGVDAVGEVGVAVLLIVHAAVASPTAVDAGESDVETETRCEVDVPIG